MKRASGMEKERLNVEPELKANLARLKAIWDNSPDVIIREFTIASETGIAAAIVCLENLVDKGRIYEELLRPLSQGLIPVEITKRSSGQIQLGLERRLANVDRFETVSVFEQVVGAICSGDTALFIDGQAEALLFTARNWAQRSIDKLETEVTVRGPREAFVETLATNLGLLRRKISHPDFKLEQLRVGDKSRTQIGIVYLKGVASEKVVAEVRRRLERIETDAILGAGYIEQWIGDAPFSIFPTLAYSERPDVVAANLLEGRVAILVDGSPEVLTVPALFIESFQSPDDYNSNPYYVTLVRWIRYIAFGISLFGPAIYIALSSYNQELIPTPLYITISAGSEGTPYPAFVEVIIIGMLFEIFREAGIRLARPIGQAIPFVAALIVAQSSVTIGLVSVATLVAVAITAMASLVIPKQANASIIIRLLLAVLASVLGTYGILLGALCILAHAASLRSFGVPCLSPVAPFNASDMFQDGIIRKPLWASLTRPRLIGWRNRQRQEADEGPQPPAEP